MMYVFTLWNQTVMPEGYTQCVDSLLVAYPSLVVERFECPDGQRPDAWSDMVRILRLSEIDGPALYVDADCDPGSYVFAGGVDRLAFAALRGGFSDVWAIYKPAGCEVECSRILREWDRSQYLQNYIMRHRDRYNSIAGYPDNRYFTHKHLGACRVW